MSASCMGITRALGRLRTSPHVAKGGVGINVNNNITSRLVNTRAEQSVSNVVSLGSDGGSGGMLARANIFARDTAARILDMASSTASTASTAPTGSQSHKRTETKSTIPSASAKRGGSDYDVVPGVRLSTYETRRNCLMDTLPEGSTVVLVGNSLRYVSENIFYKFTQNTEVSYLVGFNEPECAVVLTRDRGARDSHTMTMYVRPQDPQTAVWDGKICGLEGVTHYGAQNARDIADFPSYLRKIVSEPGTVVYTNMPLGEGGSSVATTSFGTNLPTRHSIRVSPDLVNTVVRPLGPILSRQRAFKDPEEAKMMQIAGEISGVGHRQIMRFAPVLENEADIETVFDFSCKLQGGSLSRQGYVPVVAGGINALTLHYIHNNQDLCDGDLVMVDAGFQFNGYHSDITRTFPRNGKFSTAQRELYEMVLDVQRECIDMVGNARKGSVSLEDIHREAVSMFQRKLTTLFNRYVSPQETRQLFNHHVGHYVGLDLHDTFSYSLSNPLRSGNVITIEPGVYIPLEGEEYPERFRGMGIRIEDTVLVDTQEEKGFKVLTSKAPKEVRDIEELMTNQDDIARCRAIIAGMRQ